MKTIPDHPDPKGPDNLPRPPDLYGVPRALSAQIKIEIENQLKWQKVRIEINALFDDIGD